MASRMWSAVAPVGGRETASRVPRLSRRTVAVAPRLEVVRKSIPQRRLTEARDQQPLNTSSLVRKKGGENQACEILPGFDRRDGSLRAAFAASRLRATCARRDVDLT